MVTGIIKKLIPIAIAGLGIFALANVIARPQMASQSAGALGETLGAFGTGLGSIGAGAGALLGGIGSGSAKLLDPLFSLKTLIYGDSAQAVLKEQSVSASNTSRIDPVVNSASDQPGVTPTAPSSATFAFPDGSIAEPGVPGGTVVNPYGNFANPKFPTAANNWGRDI